MTCIVNICFVNDTFHGILYDILAVIDPVKAVCSLGIYTFKALNGMKVKYGIAGEGLAVIRNKSDS